MALGGIGLGAAGFLYHDLQELNVRVMELEHKSKLSP